MVLHLKSNLMSKDSKDLYLPPYKRKKYNTSKKCLNCFKTGHVYKKCKYPIVSYGVIVYKIQENRVKILVIQRKDSISYTDFLRGKYSLKKKEHIMLLEQTTLEEKRDILSNSFETLWKKFWINHYCLSYKKEFLKAKEKFEKSNCKEIVKFLIFSKYISYKEPEYSFIKGRISMKENIPECVIREYTEESGSSPCSIRIEPKIFTEVYQSCNNKYYKHYYYLAEYIGLEEPTINKLNNKQISEVRSISFIDLEDLSKSFRFYETTKFNLIHQLKKHFENAS